MIEGKRRPYMVDHSIQDATLSMRQLVCSAVFMLLVTTESPRAQVEGVDLTDALKDLIEQQAEDGATEEADDASEDEAESELEQALKDLVESQEDVTDEVEDTVEDDLTFGGSEESVDEDVVDQAEESVEDSVSDEQDQGSEESVDEAAEEEAEDQAEQQLVDVAEEGAETEVEESVEESVVSAAEEAATDEAEDEVASEGEEQVAEATEPEVATETEVVDALGDGSDTALTHSADDRMGAEGDELVDLAETEISEDDARIHLGQWLVMAESQVFQELSQEGYVFDAITDLPSLGLRLAEVSAPASFDISVAREGIYDVVGADKAEVDLNHFYTAGVPDPLNDDGGIEPRMALAIPSSMQSAGLNIGIIDSEVDQTHPSFKTASIKSKRFTRSQQALPSFHGTAIASIFVADSDQLVGLVPESTLYSAAVFELDSEKGEVASTVSLVRSLDWLLEANVDVINLSLTGPPNRLLEVAINRVSQQGVVVLAAAGNGGPMATPKYPAAYTSVVAVTAVDSRGRAFRMANRGDYLAIAAPGVNLRHAVPGGGYSASSGTSFAVPFVSTVVALLKQTEPVDKVVAHLYASAMDLGEPGRDDIYGYGLLTLQ